MCKGIVVEIIIGISLPDNSDIGHVKEVTYCGGDNYWYLSSYRAAIYSDYRIFFKWRDVSIHV